ncbi:hypothetical protein LINGRAHAP2_LOCUS18681 [Linum grandiflorum]
MASSKLCIFFFALTIAISFSNLETAMAAHPLPRQLLQLPNIPTIPNLPSGVLPPLPGSGAIIPTFPSFPKVSLPPLPSGLPSFPNIPGVSIPGLTPPAPGK